MNMIVKHPLTCRSPLLKYLGDGLNNSFFLYRGDVEPPAGGVDLLGVGPAAAAGQPVFGSAAGPRTHLITDFSSFPSQGILSELYRCVSAGSTFFVCLSFCLC